MNENLIEGILSLIEDAPDEWVKTLTARLETLSPDVDWRNLRVQLMEITPQIGLGERLDSFLEYWQCGVPSLSPATLALVLRTAANAAARQRNRQSVERLGQVRRVCIFP